MSGEAIKATGLTKVYPGGVLAVDHVSFTVNEGEVFALLGPNGAGKSTTIGMLTTTLKPTDGTALVGGHDIIREPEKVRRVIGVVLQEYTADEDLTGYDNIMLMASLYGIPKQVAKDRALELLEMVGLSSAKDRKVETYSGGMRRRLELAMGLINRPRILFLDEPTLGLDVQTRAAIWDYIIKLKQEYGMTILVTTHYLEEADMYGDRVAIIDHGKILDIGSPDELKNKVGGDMITLETSGLVDGAQNALKSLNQVRSVELKDGKVIIKVSDGPSAIPSIVSALQGQGITILRLSMSRPTMDEVYISYTGRSLRDESGSSEEAFVMRRTIRRARA